MSASMAERTEEATPKKREDARQKGQIPKSQELSTAILLLGGALVVSILSPGLAGMLRSIFEFGIVASGAGTLDGPSAIALVQTIGWKMLAGLGTFLVAMAGLGVFINGVQAQGVLSAQPLAPDWKRIDPMTNGKRLLGSEPWVELIKSLLKLLAVGYAVHASLSDAWPEAMTLAQQSPFAFMAFFRTFAVRLLMTAGAAYLVIAGLDYLYQTWKHGEDLRMTKQEVKDEHKQAEGDPLVKAQRRAMGRAMARRQMFGEVPSADVVIRNPTHIAVAIRYDPKEADAPVVLAMGRRKIAERIIRIAEEAGVPTVENRPLARALLGNARVGDTIPPELYMAVAEILAFIIRQRQVRTSTWRGTVEA